MSKLITVIRAFLGSIDAGASLLGEALETSITVMGTHGTRAPMDEAAEFMVALTGKSDREKALVHAIKATGIKVDGKGRAMVPGCIVGRMAPDAAAALGADVSSAFILAMGEYVSIPKEKAKADPMKSGAMALGKLSKLTDSQFAKLMSTQGGADMLARIDRMHAATAAAAVMAPAAVVA